MNIASVFTGSDVTKYRSVQNATVVALKDSSCEMVYEQQQSIVSSTCFLSAHDARGAAVAVEMWHVTRMTTAKGGGRKRKEGGLLMKNRGSFQHSELPETTTYVPCK